MHTHTAAKTMLLMVIGLGIAHSALAATPATLAVVGLKTYSPVGTDCPWVGVVLAEQLAARLTQTSTGLRQVERIHVAEILRRRGLPPVDLDDRDDAELSRAAEAIRHLSELDSGQSSTRTVSAGVGEASGAAMTMTMCSNRLLGASHLLSGDVLLDKPWGQGGQLVATIRVVSVETGAVLSHSGAIAEGEASVAGLQEVQCKLAQQLCQALGGDSAQLDLTHHEEKPEVYQRYGEAQRALLEGKYEDAITLVGSAWQAASPDLLPALMQTRNEAYRAAIKRWQAAAWDETNPNRADAQKKVAELQEAYTRATTEDEELAQGTLATARYETAERLRFQKQYSEAIPKYRAAMD
ncbi:MAG: hypothetical protein ABFE07_02335, partial [Armatimonadia bacterium]